MIIIGGFYKNNNNLSARLASHDEITSFNCLSSNNTSGGNTN